MHFLYNGIIAAFPGSGIKSLQDSVALIPSIKELSLAESLNDDIIDKYASKECLIVVDEALFEQHKKYPYNYADLIYTLYDTYIHAVILVGSNELIRKTLSSYSLPFTTLVPDIDLKSEYLDRIKGTGLPIEKVSEIDEHWESLVASCSNDENSSVIKLHSKETLSMFLLS